MKKIGVLGFLAFLLIITVPLSSALTAISSCQQLQNIKDNINENYYLSQDINCNGFNFVPIGSFRGSLDGKFYKIINLKINNPLNSGLFSLNYGEIKNLKFENIDISCDSGRCGGISAINNGKIENSSVSGFIKGNFTGGLVGDNNGTIKESVSRANVNCSYICGGLAGENEKSGIILNSYSIGNVSGYVAGGLVGRDFLGVINNSYSTGKVEGNYLDEGFIGIETESRSCYWNLTFHDEFLGDSLNLSLWNYGENRYNPANEVVSKGILRQLLGQSLDFGHIVSKYAQTNGYFEASMRITNATRINNAFWVISSYRPYETPEVDFTESHYPNEIPTTFYSEGPGQDKLTLSYWALRDLSSDFNIIASDWNFTSVKNYFNGKSSGYVDKGPENYLISYKPTQIRLSTYGNMGVDGGIYTPQEARLSSMDFDYVRVYQRVSEPIESLLCPGAGNENANNNFFDKELSGIDVSPSASVVSTILMKNPKTFSDWDFNIWEFDSGYNNGYPLLSWEYSLDNDAPIFMNLDNIQLGKGKSLDYKVEAYDSSGVSCYSVNDSRFIIDCAGRLINNSIINGLVNIKISATDKAGRNNFKYIFMNFTDDNIYPIFSGNTITKVLYFPNFIQPNTFRVTALNTKFRDIFIVVNVSGNIYRIPVVNPDLAGLNAHQFISHLTLPSGNHSYYWEAYSNGTAKNKNISQTYYISVSSYCFNEDIGNSPDCPDQSSLLVDKYNLDSDVKDSIGENDGKIVGNPTFISGKVNNAINLDGIDDYVNLTDISWGKNDSFSIALWIKTENLSRNQGIIGKASGISNSEANPAWGITIRGGKLYFNYYYSSSGGFELYDTTNSLLENQWNHIDVVYNNISNYVKIYVNGNKVGGNYIDRTKEFKKNLYTAKIGLAYTSNYKTIPFNGSIDDVRIYNGTLSEKDILDLYNQFDQVYPIFYDYEHNSGTLINSGIAKFNISINNTNGTAFLHIDDYIIQASNISNKFNVSVYLRRAPAPNAPFKYYWTAYGNGFNNNSIDSGYIDYSIANIPPYVAWISPQNITYTNTNQIRIEITNNSYSSSVWYHNGTNYSAYAKPVTLTLANGQYRFRALSNNTAGNTNATNVTFIVNFDNLDPIFPSFSGFEDNNGTLIESGNALFNVTIANANGSAYVNFEGMRYPASNISDKYNVSIPVSGAGDYNYFWEAYGSGFNNNYNITENKIYNVKSAGDITLPYFIDATPKNMTLSFGSNVIQQINASDNIGLSCFKINWTTLFSINCSGYFNNISSLATGKYDINITINDTNNNKNYSVFWINITNQISSITLNLNSGWNLISTPYTLSQNINEIFGAELQGVWEYSGNYRQLGNTEILAPGKAYWVLLSSAKSVTLSGSNTPVNINLVSGWNLIGVNETKLLSSISGAQGAWDYNGNYNPATSLEKGKGYWVLK